MFLTASFRALRSGLRRAGGHVERPVGARLMEVMRMSTGSSENEGEVTSSANGELSKDTNAPATSKAASSNPATVSLFKNPIVHQLWTARQEAKERSLKAREGKAPSPTTSAGSEAPAGKTPADSRVEISYPFSSDELLLEAYRNPWGQMRFGKILEDLDALAGNIAFFHADDSASRYARDHPVIVTASVDRIRLRSHPHVGIDQTLSGQVTWTGKSSMEIRMLCCNAASGGGEEWLEAFVTFVTLDPDTKRPTALPPLLPQTAEEKAHFDAGSARAALRKQRRQQQTNISPDLDRRAQSLVEQAGPLLRMPSLADPQSILMSQTTMQNALIAQPQVRNLHNRIFGGHLMHLAWELAFANAHVFAGVRPVFLEVDQVSFTNPVDVGDLLVFHSRVLYTEPGEVDTDESSSSSKQRSLLHIQVEAWVTEPENATAKIANQFYFTFAAGGKPIRNVLPSNIEEARQMVLRMQADREQSTS